MRYYDFIFYDDMCSVIEYRDPIGKYVVDVLKPDILKTDNKYSWFQSALMFDYLPLEYIEGSMSIGSTFTNWSCRVKKIN